MDLQIVILCHIIKASKLEIHEILCTCHIHQVSEVQVCHQPRHDGTRGINHFIGLHDLILWGETQREPRGEDLVGSFQTMALQLRTDVGLHLLLK